MIWIVKCIECQKSITEDTDYNDADDDRARLGLQQCHNERRNLAPSKNVMRPMDDVIVLPMTTRKSSNEKQSVSDLPSQIQVDNGTEDRNEMMTTADVTKDDNNRDEKLLSSPKY